MNRRLRRLAGVLAAALLLLQGAAVGALAADDTYTIRIYAGNVGATIGGGTVMQLTGTYGQNITFDPSWVQLPADSQYYVRGVRKSGLDNNTVSNNVIHVTEDADYVVAYGIRGNLVSYTVNYVDGAGNTLAPSQTYYGNAGDKPVVAYLYVDDYLPQAYNLTRTLSENEASNVFTFVYTRIARPQPTPTQPPRPAATNTPAPAAGGAGQGGAQDQGGGAQDQGGAAQDQGGAVQDQGGGAQDQGGGAQNQGGAAQDQGGGAQDQGGAAQDQGGGAPDQGGAAQNQGNAVPDQGGGADQQQTAAPAPTSLQEEQVPLDEGPADLIDLDEEDTPLGKAPEAEKEKTDLQKDREQKQTKFFLSAGLLAAALAVIAATVLVLLKKRGKQP